MKCSIDRTKFKTETGRKLFDLLKNVWDDEDFIVGTLSAVKGDEKRQKLIDFIKKENITDDEIIVLAAGDIADGIEI